MFRHYTSIPDSKTRLRHLTLHASFGRTRQTVAKGRLHDRQTLLRHALTTVVREEGHDCGHSLKVSTVVEKPTLLTAGDKPCVTQLLQVKRQGGRRDRQQLRDPPGGYTLRARLYQQPICGEARFLRQRPQGHDRFLDLHISIIIKL